MSLIKREDELGTSKNTASSNRTPCKTRKVLEEDEYLGKMAKIIKRDFFPNADVDPADTPSSSLTNSVRTGTAYTGTPGTDRTSVTAISSVRSKHDSQFMRLNEFLDKYTSEDNAYFDKIQRKELRKHKAKFPWLYTDRNNHNKQVKEQLKLTANSNKSMENEISQAKMIDWHYNPKNALFYPKSDESSRNNSCSTVNYESNKYGSEPSFKEPLPVKPSDHVKGLNRFTDKIGIDGRLLSETETSSTNGYLIVPPPETPRVDDTPKPRRGVNRYFIPCESPRDDLAHRLYEEKVAKKIRTPRSSTRSDATKTPQSKLGKIF